MELRLLDKNELTGLYQSELAVDSPKAELKPLSAMLRRVLDYECALFGVRFKCLYRGPEGDDRKVEALHRGVYAGYFSPAHRSRYIQLPLRPGEEIHPAPEWMEE